MIAYPCPNLILLMKIVACPVFSNADTVVFKTTLQDASKKMSNNKRLNGMMKPYRCQKIIIDIRIINKLNEMII